MRELGISLSYLARKFRLSSTAVSLSVKRGEKLAEEKGFRLLGGAKIKQPAAAGIAQKSLNLTGVPKVSYAPINHASTPRNRKIQ